MVIQQKGSFFFLFWKAKPKKRMITSSRTRYKPTVMKYSYM